MATRIVMPQLGESVVEGQIVEWFVNVGDKVDVGQALVEVETDKANAEVPATEAGWVSQLLAQPGDTVDVGAALVELVDSADKVSGGGGASDAPTSEPEPEPQAALPDRDSAPSSSDADAAEAAPSTGSDEAKAPTSSPAPPPPRPPSRAPSAPPTRSENHPWNAGGVVAAPTPAAHVNLPMAQRPEGQRSSSRSVPAPPTRAVPPPPRERQQPEQNDGLYGAPGAGRYFRPPVVRAQPEDTVVKFSKRRGIIAEHMVYSKHVSPHVPCFAEVDMTAVSDLRRRHKGRLSEQGIRLSILAFVLKATTQALREFPGVNAVVGADEIIQRGSVHLGVAVETDGGLLVPVIRDADRLSVSGLARAVDDMAEKARDKKISVDDLSGGTFTVSNPGRRGNLFGAAIINQPQVGILRMGEIVRRPVVREVDREEVICIRSMMYLSLSYDHRIIDGVTGNGFLFRIRELLEQGRFEV